MNLRLSRYVIGAGIFLTLAGTALAAPVEADINILGGAIYNDRVGNSRFFFGAGNDFIRGSIFLTPSPDSDAAALTTNGTKTEVSINHAVFGASNPRLEFSGLKSNRGGAANEYQTPFFRSDFSAADLIALDTTRARVTITNADAPGLKSITVDAPDFDPNALPGFATSLKVTAGSAPTIEWALPTTGVAATTQSIQIRRIDAETPDRSKITAATLVHTIVLGAGVTSVTIPNGVLALNTKYEIAVQEDIRADGSLKGRSRSFFEYSPLPLGSANIAVFLPSVGPNGEFKFDINVTAGQKIPLDPIVAVGYDYQIGAGDPLFASVELPDIGDGLFDLFLFIGGQWMFEKELATGEEFFFAGAGVDRFRILGIESDAGLSPSDTTAFITNVTFADDGRFTGTMTAITASVPEPVTLTMVALGLIGIRLTSRRRHRDHEKLS
jgi:hypothetical protein